MVEQNKTVLIIGAAVIDMIVDIEKLPVTGEDVYGEHKKTMVGGCAYNVQQVIETFGIAHDLFVPVGKGPYASIIRQQLQDKKIPIHLEDDSQDNGWNISFIEKDGERTFVSVPGLEVHWQENWFERVNFKDYDFIYLSGYELEGNSGKVIAQQLVKNKAAAAKVVLDPGPRVSFLDKDVLDAVLHAGTIVHCNESELKQMISSASGSVEEAAQKLHEMTGEAVVVTMGKDGCYYLDENESGIVPAEQVTVTDTIGAGDSHTGAFISGLAKGLSIKAASELGNETSAKVIQQTGGTL